MRRERRRGEKCFKHTCGRRGYDAGDSSLEVERCSCIEPILNGSYKVQARTSVLCNKELALLFRLLSSLFSSSHSPPASTYIPDALIVSSSIDDHSLDVRFEQSRVGVLRGILEEVSNSSVGDVHSSADGELTS